MLHQLEDDMIDKGCMQHHSSCGILPRTFEQKQATLSSRFQEDNVVRKRWLFLRLQSDIRLAMGVGIRWHRNHGIYFSVQSKFLWWGLLTGVNTKSWRNAGLPCAFSSCTQWKIMLSQSLCTGLGNPYVHLDPFSPFYGVKRIIYRESGPGITWYTSGNICYSFVYNKGSSWEDIATPSIRWGNKMSVGGWN